MPFSPVNAAWHRSGLKLWRRRADRPELYTAETTVTIDERIGAAHTVSEGERPHCRDANWRRVVTESA